MKFELKKAFEILERTPSVLNSLLKDLSIEWTNKNEGENSWNPYDIVGHLIHGDKTDWIIRAQIILKQKEIIEFKEFDRFAQFENSKGKSLNKLLSEFEVSRKQNITILKSLHISEKELNLTGIHPEFGTVTLRQLLSTWVAHDLSHISQITRVMAKQYKQEIGPWIEYMNLLKDFKKNSPINWV